MRILIVDQCSASKAVTDGTRVFEEEDIDEHGREALLNQDRVVTKPARDLYAGRQQELISQAAERLRNAGNTVDRVFISAGFGVVDEDELVPAYDVTFSGRPEAEVIERSQLLDIQSSIEELITVIEGYDIVFFALGQDYYICLDLPELLSVLDDSTYIVLFNQHLNAAYSDQIISISARNEEARENGATVIALKGQFIRNFAEHLNEGAEVNDIEDIETFCTTQVTNQAELEEFEY